MNPVLMSAEGCHFPQYANERNGLILFSLFCSEHLIYNSKYCLSNNSILDDFKGTKILCNKILLQKWGQEQVEGVNGGERGHL